MATGVIYGKVFFYFSTFSAKGEFGGEEEDPASSQTKHRQTRDNAIFCTDKHLKVFKILTG